MAWTSVVRVIAIGTLSGALSWSGSTARADVIPDGYRPPPPPQCPTGARPRASRGRGHGAWAGCEATTCTTDADCGALGPCRELALCVTAEIEDHAPRPPGTEPERYRIASLACDAQGACPSTYECRTELRCVGSPPPPAPVQPAAQPAVPPAVQPGTSPITPPSPQPQRGACSVTLAPASSGLASIAAALASIAAALAARRRRAR